MTRLAMEAAIYDWLSKAGTASIDANTQRRIRGYLNASIREVLSLPGMEPARATTQIVTTVADQDAVGLPLQFTRIDRIVDRANHRPLLEKDMAWLRDVQPDPAPSGTPLVWIPYGWQAVQQQPDRSKVFQRLFVQSTNGSDLTQTAHVAGFLRDGLPHDPPGVTLAGATFVNVDPAIVTWDAVSKFYLSAVCLGVVSLHDENGGSGIMLAQIPIGRTSSRYQSIRLWPTPSTALTYHVDGIQAITDLAADTDSPPCTEDFHEVFVFGACYRELLKLDDTRAQDFKALHDAKVKQLQGDLNDNASLRLIPGRRDVGYSNLPSGFPADGWR